MKLRYTLQGECKRCGNCCKNEECEFLKFENNIAVCTIYEDRFFKCRNWPCVPPIMIKGCGFYFIDTWENNRIVEQGKI